MSGWWALFAGLVGFVLGCAFTTRHLARMYGFLRPDRLRILRRWRAREVGHDATKMRGPSGAGGRDK
jgi:hypothetical protein